MLLANILHLLFNNGLLVYNPSTSGAHPLVCALCTQDNPPLSASSASHSTVPTATTSVVSTTSDTDNTVRASGQFSTLPIAQYLSQLSPSRLVSTKLSSALVGGVVFKPLTAAFAALRHALISSRFYDPSSIILTTTVKKQLKSEVRTNQAI